MNSDQSHFERLRQAFDLRNRSLETKAFALVSTVLASVALASCSDKSAQDKLPSTPIVTTNDASPLLEQSLLQPDSDQLEDIEIKETRLSTKIFRPYSADFTASEMSEDEKKKIDDLADTLNTIAAKPQTEKINVKITSYASDGSRADSQNGDGNLGKKSDNNVALARAELKNVVSYLTPQLKNPELLTITDAVKESILSEKEIKIIDEAAENHGISRVELLRKNYAGDTADLTKTERKDLADSINSQHYTGIETVVAEKVEGTSTNKPSVETLEQEDAPVATTKDFNQAEATSKDKSGNLDSALYLAPFAMLLVGAALYSKRNSIKNNLSNVISTLHTNNIPSIAGRKKPKYSYVYGGYGNGKKSIAKELGFAFPTFMQQKTIRSEHERPKYILSKKLKKIKNFSPKIIGAELLQDIGRTPDPYNDYRTRTQKILWVDKKPFAHRFTGRLARKIARKFM